MGKEKLKKCKPGDFVMQVAMILLQYSTNPHVATGHAPCELLLSWMRKVPLDALRINLRATALLKQLRQEVSTYHGCCPRPLLDPGVPVYGRNVHPVLP